MPDYFDESATWQATRSYFDPYNHSTQDAQLLGPMKDGLQKRTTKVRVFAARFQCKPVETRGKTLSDLDRRRLVAVNKQRVFANAMAEVAKRFIVLARVLEVPQDRHERRHDLGRWY